MDVLGTLSWLAGIAVSYGPPFLVVLLVVVFFHELGHFLVARWGGVAVKAFSIGFGPEIVGFDDRHGTRWKLCWIPLGGYVKFMDDDNAASVPDRDKVAAMTAAERAGSFHAKPVAIRAAVVAAGPIANFLLAIVIFAAVFTIGGRAMIPAKIGSVNAESAAAAAGLQPGDVIRALDGHQIESFGDVQRYVLSRAEVPIELTYERGGALTTVTVTPRLFEEKTRFGVQRRGLLGLTADARQEDVVIKHYSPPAAVWEGVKETWFIVARTGEYIGRVIVGRESADQLGGPLRVAQISGEVAQLGLDRLIWLTAVLSVSIGLINLMPIPMLDGGHLVYYAAEAVRGRPLSERFQEVGFRVGLAIILMLFLFATKNDILHLIGLS